MVIRMGHTMAQATGEPMRLNPHRTRPTIVCLRPMGELTSLSLPWNAPWQMPWGERAMSDFAVCPCYHTNRTTHKGILQFIPGSSHRVSLYPPRGDAWFRPMNAPWRYPMTPPMGHTVSYAMEPAVRYHDGTSHLDDKIWRGAPCDQCLPRCDGALSI